jgi:hypothetical protein
MDDLGVGEIEGLEASAIGIGAGRVHRGYTRGLNDGRTSP